jgi:hypothetical protein
MLDPSKPSTSTLPAANTTLEFDPNQPIEVVSAGTSTTNDPSGTDKRPVAPTPPIGS